MVLYCSMRWSASSPSSVKQSPRGTANSIERVDSIRVPHDAKRKQWSRVLKVDVVVVASEMPPAYDAEFSQAVERVGRFDRNVRPVVSVLVRKAMSSSRGNSK